LNAFWPIVSDGEKVYYHRPYGSASDESEHATEEPRDVVFSWDLQGAPELIEEYWISIGQLAPQDGFVYVLGNHHTFGSRFSRTSLDGTMPSVGLSSSESITRFWFTEDAVWWSQYPNYQSDKAELWRRPRLGMAISELVASADHDGWGAGNASVAFRARYYPSSEAETLDLVRDTLSDLTETATIGTYTRARGSRPGDDIMLADDQALFITLGARGTQLTRIELDDPSRSLPLAPQDVQTRNVFLEGSWVYWGAQLDDQTASINRTHRDGTAEPEELLRGELDPTLFTATADVLVYSNGERFFVKPLAQP
jgi:hypothetical protein